MREWLLPMGLSLIVTVGVWTGRCPAQTPVGPPARTPTPAFYPPPPQGPGIPMPAIYPPVQQGGPLLVPFVPYEPAYHPPYPAAIAPQMQPPLATNHLQRTLNRYGMGCENNYWGACGSLQYDCLFAFGSCRAFFGDRCVPGQGCSSRQGQR